MANGLCLKIVQLVFKKHLNQKCRQFSAFLGEIFNNSPTRFVYFLFRHKMACDVDLVGFVGEGVKLGPSITKTRRGSI